MNNTTNTRPFDHAAEQALLGRMLINPNVIDDITELVAADDLYRPAHSIVFATISGLRDRGEPTSELAVLQALIATGDVTKVGGAAYLAELTEAAQEPGDHRWLARNVAELAELRLLVETSTRISQLVGNTSGAPGSVRDTVDTAGEMLREVTGRATGNEPRAWADVIVDGIDSIEQAAAYAGQLRGISTGLPDLDRLLNGLQAGQLVVVAGRPGAGKSVLAVDLARAAALHHSLSTGIVSLEMSEVEVFSRVMAAECSINLSSVIAGTLTDREWARLATRAGETSDAPLHIVDTPNMRLADIRSTARRLKRRHDLQLLIVDYLQLVTTPKSENRQVAVAEMSRGLKLLAKELNIPVVAVAQLNRGSETRGGDKRPQLSDLRESGALEQDSDVVVFVHRPAYYNPDDRPGEADLIVAKNRNGPTDTIAAAAQLHFARFVSMAIVEEPAERASLSVIQGGAS